jgi:hypothetical protein
MKNRVHFSSLAIIVVLLVFVPAGLGGFTEVAPDAHAQRSSSCDRVVVSLVDCSRSTSSSDSSDDSSTDDDDEKNNKDDNGDKGNNKDKDQKEDKNDGDIESKIPSTLPFP